MKLTENGLYIEDIEYVAGLELPWHKLMDSSVLLTGGTGLIGTCLVDVIMFKNQNEHLNCQLYLLTRNKAGAEKRFVCYGNDPELSFIEHDINEPIGEINANRFDYLIHMASNTHPVAYATDPIGTITTNVIGTKNVLDYACECEKSRVVFASSNEIYGNNRGDTELFSEDYCGYINSNTLRAGYPESKRCGEALCQAYIKQKGLDVVIPRLTRTYGPSMLDTDTKAISQFIKKALGNEDIVLKSSGSQYYSFTYVADAVAGLLTVMLRGECGEAYNVADRRADITLRELAEMIAQMSGNKVVYEIPDEIEAAGYSKAQKSRLDGSKLHELGWAAHYDIREGIERTLRIMKS